MIWLLLSGCVIKFLALAVGSVKLEKYTIRQEKLMVYLD